MIGTILKHELLRTAKPIGIIAGICALLGVLGASLSLFWGPLGPLVAAVFTMLLVPAIQWYLGIDFYLVCYAGRAASLTHTLPVTGRALFWTKLGYSLAVSAVMLAVTGALLALEFWAFVAALGVHAQPLLATFAALLFGSAGAWAFTLSILAIAVAAVPVTLFFCAVVGSGRWARRLSVAGPIIVYIALGIVLQIVSIALAFVPPQLDLQTGQLLAGVNFFAPTGDSVMPLLALVAQVPIHAGLALWAGAVMHRRVELS